MNEPKPWLREIAERLSAIHEASGVTGKDLAERLGWAASKVTRIRKGITEPTRDEVAAWAQETGAAATIEDLLAILAAVPRHRMTFRERMTEGQAPVQRNHNDLTRDSTVVRYFDMAWLCGFLQTREYARWTFEEMRDLHTPPDDIENAIELRLGRKQYLHDTAKRFELLMDEAVLLRSVVPAAVMVPQLQVISWWLTAPTVSVGILPLRGSNRRMPQNSFQMYDDLVIVEGFGREDDDGDPVLHERVFRDMWTHAAVGPDAQPLIEAAIEIWSKEA